jgi:NRPS condensation-like uncharacterized protein
MTVELNNMLQELEQQYLQKTGKEHPEHFYQWLVSVYRANVGKTDEEVLTLVKEVLDNPESNV